MARAAEAQVKRVWKLLALGCGAYLVFAVATLPAEVVLGRLPVPGLQATGVSGSIWDGRAAGLFAAGLNLGSVEWRLDFLPLLFGRVRIELVATRSDGFARGTLLLRPGRSVALEDWTASVPVKAATELGVPGGWQGTARAELAEVLIDNGWVADARGTVEGIDLTGPERSPVNIGSYRVTLPADTVDSTDGIVGRLEDIGGPLAVRGQIRLGRDRSYLIEGRVAARPDAPRSVMNAIQYLGAPDADGSRPFAIEGTL